MKIYEEIKKYLFFWINFYKKPVVIYQTILDTRSSEHPFSSSDSRDQTFLKAFLVLVVFFAAIAGLLDSLYTVFVVTITTAFALFFHSILVYILLRLAWVRQRFNISICLYISGLSVALRLPTVLIPNFWHIPAVIGIALFALGAFWGATYLIKLSTQASLSFALVLSLINLLFYIFSSLI
ncbi:MAG: hypothetical protein COT74_13530 [Bdellovibrionales bacterium CG10_big_fil_rev_8_21_14_0_10_45_34]|nr:MAG: hypothetical protein COT74_13530 [Bdellovibrionales bacterium CG10_big_fil_rev_8_21_14_0_10_45_34]